MDRKKSKQKEIAEKNVTDMVLKKHVGLIHCENKLSLIQRKICNILLFNALDKINEETIHEIPLRKLCSLIGYNSNDSKQIKESVKTLISTVMEWNLLDDSKFLNETEYPEEAITWNASSLLAGASIKNGLIHYSYSPQMKSVLSSLDIYGRINLFVQAKFASTYSLVLYENCIRFKSIKKTSWFALDLFRSLMGVPKGKYASFKDFNRKVISVAVNEINQKSDIYIEPQFKRTNRSITAIQFTVNENDHYKPSFKKMPDRTPDTAPSQATLAELLLTQFKLSEQQIQDVFITYEQKYVLEKINLVTSKKNVDHPGAYLLAALKQDYRPSTTPSAHTVMREVRRVGATHEVGQYFAKEKGDRAESVTEAPYLREAKAAIQITPLRNKYMAYKLSQYQDFVSQQTKAVQVTVKEKFEQFIAKNTEICRFYKKSGFKSPFVMSAFLTFMEDHFSDMIGAYLSFDDYITSEEN